MCDLYNMKGLCGKQITISILFFLVIIFLPHSKSQDISATLPCTSDSDCQSEDFFIFPYPYCLDHRCQCNHTVDSCLHYTYGRYNIKPLYYCSQCGTLGSECSPTLNDCPGKCTGGFCECDTGYIKMEICIYYYPVSTTRKSIFLILSLIAILILNKLVQIRTYFRRICCRCIPFCRSNDNEDESRSMQASNPNSQHKSASYTIIERDFLVTSDDPDLELALELSRLEANTVDGNCSPTPSITSRLSHIQQHSDVFLRCHRRQHSSSLPAVLGDERSLQTEDIYIIQETLRSNQLRRTSDDSTLQDFWSSSPSAKSLTSYLTKSSSSFLSSSFYNSSTSSSIPSLSSSRPKTTSFTLTNTSVSNSSDVAITCTPSSNSVSSSLPSKKYNNLHSRRAYSLPPRERRRRRLQQILLSQDMTINNVLRNDSHRNKNSLFSSFNSSRSVDNSQSSSSFSNSCHQA